MPNEKRYRIITEYQFDIKEEKYELSEKLNHNDFNDIIFDDGWNFETKEEYAIYMGDNCYEVIRFFSESEIEKVKRWASHTHKSEIKELKNEKNKYF